MPAKKAAKKASTKKAASKKPAAKKSAAKAVAKQQLTFTLDAAQAAAIRRCLTKGTLKVTVNKADLARGRIRDPWLYD
jgi:hypothetical protein